MNASRRSHGPNWAKIVAITIILAIAAYQWYQNNQQSGLPRPGNSQQPIGQSESADDDEYQITFEPKAGRENDSNSKRAAPETGGSWKPSVANSADTRKSGSSGSWNRPSATDQPSQFLQPAGGKNLKSPAGLIYTMGPGGEHRVEHVMRHAQDDPQRPSHGVFDGDQDTILKLIDEAYELVKAKSKYVKSESSQGNTAYTISLGRRIGYEGGEKGIRSQNRPLKSLRLILDGDRVITAYPYR